jgi:hypothetical protein
MGDSSSNDRGIGGGGSGDGDCDVIGTDGGSSPIIIFVTFVTRVEPEFECVLRKSDRELMAASPALLPNDSFHLLGFFVTAGIDTGTGTGGGVGISGND